ncbi:MAG: oxidoreductase [Acidaminococcus sp.]|uniref:oxidoreductase n=1 Tax=Acidaminococcus sp. TaxID=1872103 RepID=UPI003F183A54
METWLITGCSRGIGRSLAKVALEKGYNVVLTARNPETLADLTAGYPKQALAVALDVTDLEAIRAAVETAEKRFGSVDVLVNNAGYAYRAAIEEGEWSKVEALYKTNLFGPIQLIRAVLPHMRAQKKGAIINFSSIAAVKAAVGSGYYASAKAGLEGMSSSLRRELAPLGIKVMVVEPGPFRTGFQDALTDSTTQIGDYAATAWKTRKANLHITHDEQGDPDRAAEIIVDTIAGDDYPEHLVLGASAVDYIKTTFQERLQEIDQWADVSRKADFPAWE